MSINWNMRGTNYGNLGKIQLIKEMRMKADCGLKEAKDAIEDAGEVLPDTATEQEILARALYLLDPNRYPLPAEDVGLDYEMMWESLKDDYSGDGAIYDHMVEIERLAKEKAKRKAIQAFIDRTVSGTLSYRFSEVQGLDTICVYDKQGDFTPLDISKAQFKDMLVTAFNSWLKGI
jgi:hypothetical protein